MLFPGCSRQSSDYSDRCERRQAPFQSGRISVSINDGPRVPVGVADRKVDGERIVKTGVWRSTQVLKPAVENSVGRAEHQLGCELVSQADAWGKVRKRRIAYT